MTQRRNPLAGYRIDQPAAPGDPVAGIPVAQALRRKRQWETEHRARFYRGIPTELRQQVLELARHLSVAADEVALAFFDFGLTSLKGGTLRINSYPKARRMTLFPPSAGQGRARDWSDVGSGPLQPTEIPGRGKKAKSSNQRPAWISVASYRVPDSIHADLKRVAGEHDVPVGEIAALLLKHGLRAYEAGELKLTTYPKIIRATLQEGSE